MEHNINKIRELMELLEAAERQVPREMAAGAGENWKPITVDGQNAFRELISSKNREALKAWYANIPSINEKADQVRQALEQATNDCLKVGR